MGGWPEPPYRLVELRKAIYFGSSCIGFIRYQRGGTSGCGTGSGVSNIDLSIYDLNFNELGECNESSYSGEQVINCIAANEGKNVSISGGNYYVCVKTDTPQDNPNDNYYINYQTQSPLCGFWGNSAPKTGGTTNYAIFAQPGNFSTIGSFILNYFEMKHYLPPKNEEGVSQ